MTWIVRWGRRRSRCRGSPRGGRSRCSAPGSSRTLPRRYASHVVVVVVRRVGPVRAPSTCADRPPWTRRRDGDAEADLSGGFVGRSDLALADDDGRCRRGSSASGSCARARCRTSVARRNCAPTRHHGGTPTGARHAADALRLRCSHGGMARFTGWKAKGGPVMAKPQPARPKSTRAAMSSACCGTPRSACTSTRWWPRSSRTGATSSAPGARRGAVRPVASHGGVRRSRARTR